jgi:hypothetical protein
LAQDGFGSFANRSTRHREPWALLVALSRIATSVTVGRSLRVPPQPRELGFRITRTTFFLGFVVEQESSRDPATIQVTLDEISHALAADRSRIDIAERPPKEIDSVRDATHTREGRRTVG